MDALMQLHAAQPYWIWLAIGVALLAIEAAFSTEWLLWPAVAAGMVAVVTAIGAPLNLIGEVALFAVVTVILTLLSRRLIQRVNPTDSPDINAREGRLVGQRAQVIQPFVNGRGRVFVSGAEWTAEVEDAAPLAGDIVIVEATQSGRLKVRPL